MFCRKGEGSVLGFESECGAILQITDLLIFPISSETH
jgi:hypothetical protein